MNNENSKMEKGKREQHRRSCKDPTDDAMEGTGMRLEQQKHIEKFKFFIIY